MPRLGGIRPTAMELTNSTFTDGTSVAGRGSWWECLHRGLYYKPELLHSCVCPVPYHLHQHSPYQDPVELDRTVSVPCHLPSATSHGSPTAALLLSQGLEDGVTGR